MAHAAQLSVVRSNCKLDGAVSRNLAHPRLKEKLDPISVELLFDPEALPPALAVDNDVRDDAAGNCSEHVLIVGSHPMIAAWWLSQMVVSPIRHYVLLIAILGRKPIAARPMRPISHLVSSLIAIAAFVLIAVILVAASIIVPILLLLRNPAVTIGRIAVVLRKSCRATKHGESNGWNNEFFHGNSLV